MNKREVLRRVAVDGGTAVLSDADVGDRLIRSVFGGDASGSYGVDGDKCFVSGVGDGVVVLNVG